MAELSAKDSPGDGASRSRHRERLDSWKEIAAHFDRTVRTVQTWEKQEGLPVHRHRHKKLGTVYAYVSELDAWWETRRLTLPERHVPKPKHRDTARAATIAAAVLLIGSLAALSSFPRNKDPVEPNVMVLRHAPEPREVMLIGRPSPGGRLLSYADVDGNLALVDVATGNKLLPLGKASAETPDGRAYWTAVAPDERQVAYAWHRRNEGFMDLRVIGVDGSNPRVIHENESVEEFLWVDWTPGGDQILAEIRLNNAEHLIALISMSGGFEVLKRAEWGTVSGMSLSPDGRYLALGLRRAGSPRQHRYDVFVIDVQTGAELPVVEHEARDDYPIWTPDGGSLLFRSDRAGADGLWKLAVKNGRPAGEPEVVRKDLGLFRPLGLTRDGAYYLYVQTGVAEIQLAQIRRGSVEDRRSLGGRYVGAGLFSDWSPDGRRIAYVVQHGNRRLFVRDLELGREREVVPDLAHFGRLRWTPDGYGLYLKGTQDGQRGVFRHDLHSDLTTFVFQDGSLGDFEPSPNGTLYYWSGGALFARDPESGRVDELAGSDIFNITLSLDGRWLAFTRRARALYAMPAAGGAPLELFRVTDEEERVLAQSWLHDGETLLFTRQRGTERSLWAVSRSGGEPVALGLRGEMLRELRMHPDGERVAFTSGSPHREVWVMENFLSDPDERSSTASR